MVQEPRFFYDLNANVVDVIELLFCFQVQRENTSLELARCVACTYYFGLHYIKQGMVRPNKQYWDTLISIDCSKIEVQQARDAPLAKNVAQNINKYSNKFAIKAKIKSPVNNKICYENNLNNLNDSTSRNLNHDAVGLFYNHYCVADKICSPSIQISNSQYQNPNNS
jgi:hypothetical protein